MSKPRVVIADDHQLVLAGLRLLLAPDCDIVGTASDGDGLLKEVQRVRPDIVVQDVFMPGLGAIDVVHKIREIDLSIKIIIVTMSADPELVAQMLQAGASAYVLKDCATRELLDAIDYAMGNKIYVTPLIGAGVIQSLSPSAEPAKLQPHLTKRQREVLRLLAEGKSMKEVADVLHIGVRTVAFHKYRIMQQLNIKTNAELVRFAVAEHLV